VVPAPPMTTIQHINSTANGGAIWREQCARLTRSLAAACAVGVVPEDGDVDSCESKPERCVRLVRGFAGTCAACVAAEKSGDTSSGAQLLEQCARFFRELASMCVGGDTADAICDDSLTLKLLRKAFAACVAAEEAGHTTRGATWREKDTRLTLVQDYANVAELAAEVFGDDGARNAAHIAYGEAEDELKRLRNDHVDEIEADYDEIWAALEAEREAQRRSALCSTERALSHVRRSAQARSRARRSRRARPRRPASSSDSDGDGPGARREHGTPTSLTIAGRGEERTW
jgi:hypothetical protein